MEFKGTKGKWEVKHSESKDAFNVIGTVLGGKYKIARCPYPVTDYKPLDEKEKAETEANAKLIAAAPELLEALKRWVKFADSQNLDFESSMIRDSKKAIQKVQS